MFYSIAAFYRFTPLADIVALRQRWLKVFAAWDLCGSLLIAPEGINGTLAGPATDIDAMLTFLGAQTGLSRDEIKFSRATARPFQRLKLRLKKEIITFKQPGADPTRHVGRYIDAGEWNNLTSDPDMVVLDTRNRYESTIGSFTGARIPDIGSFTEFAAYVRAHLSPDRHKKIAMFCTGGIRCEKASAFMLSEGFEEVYHLKGGILKYLETVPPEQSRWNGECYVFDRRISVGHGLRQGQHSMCFSCGYPLNACDKEHALYEEGVSCSHCHQATSVDDKARFRARQQHWQQNSVF